MNVTMNSKAFTLDALPYDEDALAPTISSHTMRFHYGKHHKAYVDKLNRLVADTDYADMKLEDLVKLTFRDSSRQGIFDNAAQAWNHAFFWKCLSPNASSPSGKLESAIERDLGGLSKFKSDFIQQGVAQFGSGWVWLIIENGKLKIEKTADAVTPMAEGKQCLLAIDVWEHAYYLDYQNRRSDFLQTVVDNLLNWNFAGENFGRID